MKEQIMNYTADVMKEMKKVTWPTKDELKDQTTIVLVSSVLIALFIFVVDKIIAQLMTMLLGS